MTMLLDRDPLYTRINCGLAVIASESAEPPAWYEALVALGPHPTDEERLAAYQSIFHGEDLPLAVGFFLVARQVHLMTVNEGSHALDDLGNLLDAIREAHGLQEDEDWRPGETPVEYQRLERQFDDLTYELYAQKLEQVGEEWMAFVLRWNRELFERFWANGRRHLYGPKTENGPEVDEECLRAASRNALPDDELRKVRGQSRPGRSLEAADDRPSESFTTTQVASQPQG